MKTFNLKKYGPIISDKDVGNEIFSEITKILESNRKISIDFSETLSMATFCSKQIFGKLYLNLSPSVFFERIVFLNASENVKLIIRIGIENALEETQAQKI